MTARSDDEGAAERNPGIETLADAVNLLWERAARDLKAQPGDTVSVSVPLPSMAEVRQLLDAVEERGRFRVTEQLDTRTVLVTQVGFRGEGTLRVGGSVAPSGSPVVSAEGHVSVRADITAEATVTPGGDDGDLTVMDLLMEILQTLREEQINRPALSPEAWFALFTLIYAVFSGLKGQG